MLWVLLMRPPYQAGDIVRHTGKFLRNTGQYTGSPINGEVQSVSDFNGRQLLTVEWSDGHTCGVIACNVEFCPKGRALTLQRRAAS